MIFSEFNIIHVIFGMTEVDLPLESENFLLKLAHSCLIELLLTLNCL
jgi:hypothetical protein